MRWQLIFCNKNALTDWLASWEQHPEIDLQTQDCPWHSHAKYILTESTALYQPSPHNHVCKSALFCEFQPFGLVGPWTLYRQYSTVSMDMLHLFKWVVPRCELLWTALLRGYKGFCWEMDPRQTSSRHCKKVMRHLRARISTGSFPNSANRISHGVVVLMLEHLYNGSLRGRSN